MRKSIGKIRDNRTSRAYKHEFWFIPALILVSILIRIPFLENFNIVAFDGTYYIRQAITFFRDYRPYGGYPIGYPFFIACLIPMLRDGVHAAQAVSLLFSLGSVLILYALAGNYLRKETAFACALIYSIIPLCIRYSLITMSEATFIFWILLCLYLFSKNMHVASGLSIGVAAITRPEAISSFAVLALMRIRKFRQISFFTSGFVLVFSLNVAVYYHSTGYLKILPKKHLIAPAFTDWRAGEFKLEQASERDETAIASKESGIIDIALHYFPRLISEGRQLMLHILPMVLLLAIYGFIKRPLFIAAPVLQFFLFPLFNIRISPRYILPYIPIVLLFSFIGLETIRRRKIRVAAYSLLFVSIAFSLVMNRSQYMKPVSKSLMEQKEAGLYLKGIINKGSKIADRKPYLAFYAGGEYVKIPDNPYEEIMQYLIEKKVDYLSLHKSTIKLFRPSLLPLLLDPFVINGELRFSQSHTLPKRGRRSIFIYKRVRDDSPLKWKKLTNPPSGDDTSPAWSPDGSRIAFSSSRTGNGDIYIIPSSGGRPRLVAGGPDIEELPAWSPDGREIAFISNRSGNFDIFVLSVQSGKVKQITSDPATDSSPSWTRNSASIVFFSDRTGRPEIWEKDLASGKLHQISTEGDNKFLSVSPSGVFMAWLHGREEVVVYDRTTGEKHHPFCPGKLYFAPSWSPDEKFIAVTSSDWGSGDVYLLRRDGRNALLLTKLPGSEGQPAWSPKGDTIAIVSNRGGRRCIWLVGGLDPFLERLKRPVDFLFLTEEGDEAKHFKAGF